MSLDGQNEILISEDEWCSILARVAQMERELVSLQSYCEAMVLEFGLPIPPWLELEGDVEVNAAEEEEESDLAPKLIAWLCGKRETLNLLEDG